MAVEKVSLSDKQYLAKILYTREKLDGKVVAKKVGVTEKTISSWVDKFSWKNLRNRLLVGKDEVLENLYEQINELNTHIKSKGDGKRFGTPSEADTLIKYTASIRNLETDLAVADIIDSGILFIKFVQSSGTLEQVLEISDLWNSFIQTQIKR
jgi:hypothetical protein